MWLLLASLILLLALVGTVVLCIRTTVPNYARTSVSDYSYSRRGNENNN